MCTSDSWKEENHRLQEGDRTDETIADADAIIPGIGGVPYIRGQD